MDQVSLFIGNEQRDVVEKSTAIFAELQSMTLEDRVETINAIRRELHKYSPFAAEPVDCVLWVKSEFVEANDYNPNSVAPPEMKLLEHSITEDGYTQPIVSWNRDKTFEVVDGFHRHRVGKESDTVRARVHGYLPLVSINEGRIDKSDRIAATIRHNRARGKHKVEAMSDIVVELKRRNWSDDKIARELGMDADEVLRLCQITGLAEVFADQDFTAAWDIEGQPDSDGTEFLKDEHVEHKDRNGRVYHTWDKWECYLHGFYEERPPNGMTQEQGEELYREFLSDLPRFEAALQEVTTTWKNSCEHYLTNDRMNRIAWLGQASVAQALRIPSCCRGGYNLLTDSQKKDADLLALKYLNIWLKNKGRDEIPYEQALSRTEAELY